jgi:hypothetical protein
MSERYQFLKEISADLLFEKQLDFPPISGRLPVGSTKHNIMKSKKNLTRFTYETAAFEGWRLCISRAGSSFTRYFPDKKLGGPKKSLAVAEKALAEVKAIIEGSKRVDGKLSPATVKKVDKFLKEAVV